METLQGFLLTVPVLLFSVVAHEVAHGYAALKQGDQTALLLGRLTFNPVRHIDPWMTVIMPALIYFGTGGRMLLGGAKPVPVDPRNYKHPRLGDIIVSLAGVATNLVVAVLCAALVPLFGYLGTAAPGLEPSLAILQAMMIRGVLLNMLLIAFNLLPIPPLDGSHVFKYLLPRRLAFRYQRLGFAGLLFVLLVMNFAPGLLDAWMTPAMTVGSLMIGGVGRHVLPSAEQWLR